MCLIKTISLKKISVIFSFFLITVFSTGSFFIHKSYLKSYKKEFKLFVFQNKTHANYNIIKINPSELYTNSKTIIWEDENKEVVYKGVLYDIVCIKTIGTKVELTAVSDEQEMELKKQFSSLYDINSNKTTKEPVNLLKSFFALKYLVPKTILDLNHLESILKPTYIHSVFKISSGFISQTNPPPNFFA